MWEVLAGHHDLTLLLLQYRDTSYGRCDTLIWRSSFFLSLEEENVDVVLLIETFQRSSRYVNNTTPKSLSLRICTIRIKGLRSICVLHQEVCLLTTYVWCESNFLMSVTYFRSVDYDEVHFEVSLLWFTGARVWSTLSCMSFFYHEFCVFFFREHAITSTQTKSRHQCFCDI